MTDKKIEKYSDYKDKRRQLINKIEYHKGQEQYHRALAKATEEKLEELQSQHTNFESTLYMERSTTNQQQIDRMNREAALDKEELKRRINLKKANSLLESMMKNFK